MGCKMLGHTSEEGYGHEESKASLGNNKFCGLLCDAVNQPEMSEKRVNEWVAQLVAEGILEKSSGQAAVAEIPVVTVEEVLSTESITTAPTTAIMSHSAASMEDNTEEITKLADENAKLRQMLEEKSR